MRLLRKAAFVGHHRLLKRGLSRHSRYSESIIREHRAGKYEIDIVGTSAVTFAGMKDSGVIAPYVSPEATQLRPNMRDPAGWWVAYFGNIQAIICNRARVK